MRSLKNGYRILMPVRTSHLAILNLSKECGMRVSCMDTFPEDYDILGKFLDKMEII